MKQPTPAPVRCDLPMHWLGRWEMPDRFRLVSCTIVSAPIERVLPMAAGLMRAALGPVELVEEDPRSPFDRFEDRARAVEEGRAKTGIKGDLNPIAHIGVAVWSPAGAPGITVIEHPWRRALMTRIGELDPGLELLTLSSELLDKRYAATSLTLRQGVEVLRRVATGAFVDQPWSFEEQGEPIPGEKPAKYKQRAKSRRLERQDLFDLAQRRAVNLQACLGHRRVDLCHHLRAVDLEDRGDEAAFTKLGEKWRDHARGLGIGAPQRGAEGPEGEFSGLGALFPPGFSVTPNGDAPAPPEPDPERLEAIRREAERRAAEMQLARALENRMHVAKTPLQVLQIYREKLTAFAGSSSWGAEYLAEWGLDAFRRAIRLDPNCREAEAILGLARIEAAKQGETLPPERIAAARALATRWYLDAHAGADFAAQLARALTPEDLAPLIAEAERQSRRGWPNAHERAHEREPGLLPFDARERLLTRALDLARGNFDDPVVNRLLRMVARELSMFAVEDAVFAWDTLCRKREDRPRSDAERKARAASQRRRRSLNLVDLSLPAAYLRSVGMPQVLIDVLIGEDPFHSPVGKGGLKWGRKPG